MNTVDKEAAYRVSLKRAIRSMLTDKECRQYQINELPTPLLRRLKELLEKEKQ